MQVAKILTRIPIVKRALDYPYARYLSVCSLIVLLI
jgi:hypothetical protein